MAGHMFAVEVVYLGEVVAALRKARIDLEDWEPLWDDIGETMAQHIAETFATAGFGYWEPLQMSTQMEKERLGYPPDPMIRTGALLESLTDPQEAGEVAQGRSTLGTFGRKAYSYGTDVDYARYHASHPDHNPNLPVRDPIIVTPGLLGEIENHARDFLREVFTEAGFQPKG